MAKAPRAKATVANDNDLQMFEGKLYKVADIRKILSARKGKGKGSQRREEFVKQILAQVNAAPYKGSVSKEDLKKMIASQKAKAKADKAISSKIGLTGVTIKRMLDMKVIGRLKEKGWQYFFSITPDGLKKIGVEVPKITPEEVAKQLAEIMGTA
jgi:hypothetical protein